MQPQQTQQPATTTNSSGEQQQQAASTTTTASIYLQQQQQRATAARAPAASAAAATSNSRKNNNSSSEQQQQRQLHYFSTCNVIPPVYVSFLLAAATSMYVLRVRVYEFILQQAVCIREYKQFSCCYEPEAVCAATINNMYVQQQTTEPGILPVRSSRTYNKQLVAVVLLL